MNFADALFPSVWQTGAFVVLVPFVLFALWRAPWQRLRDGGQLNVFLGTVVMLSLVWSMKAGVKPGLNMHLLGATMFTLMFGRELATLGLLLVLAVVSFNTGLHAPSGWMAYGLNALVLAVLPPLLADAVRRVVERWLPPNFFIYIFITAFFGAAIVAVGSGLVATTLLWLADVYPAQLLFDEYFPYYLLLGFSEAWLNGAMVTVMVIYLPHWVGTFDDRRYLWKR